MSDPLRRYAPPARWNDFRADAGKARRLREIWSDRVAEALRSATNPGFYDPQTTRIGDARPERVEWTAFPKSIADAGGSFADAEDRSGQGEYCEWCVARDETGKVVRVEFTSETPEYWQDLWTVDPDRVVELYRELVSPRVQRADLESGGDYRPGNRWNTGSEYRADEGGLAHLVVGINTLGAAVGVVSGAAQSTDDLPTGGGDFHADPHIALSVQRVIHRLNARVSFSDPVGIYLGEPDFHRYELPAVAPRSMRIEECWRVTRGNRRAGQALHAVFEVPRGKGFVAGDIRIDGQPIRFGSQLARTLKSGTFVTPIPR